MESVSQVEFSGSWVSESQSPSPRDPFPGSWVSEYHVPESQFQGPGCQGPVSQGLTVPAFRVPGLRVSGSWVARSRASGSRVSWYRVSDSWGPRYQVPGSQVRVLGPDFRLCPFVFHINLINMEHKREHTSIECKAFGKLLPSNQNHV